MQPINKAERQTAFISFLLLFVITTGLVVLAVYFGMQIPFKQNEQLRQKMAVVESERNFALSFAGRMSDTKSLLDSVNLPEVRADLIDGTITERLKSMNAMVDNDSVAVKTLFQNVIQSYADLQQAKKQLRNASGMDKNMEAYIKEIETLKNSLMQANNQINVLNSQLISAQQRR